LESIPPVGGTMEELVEEKEKLRLRIWFAHIKPHLE